MYKTHRCTHRLHSLAGLFGTASILALASTAAAQAPAVTAEPIEEVLVTGSLIRGAVAVGVPVTSLGAEDFSEVGALTIADLLRKTPSLFVTPSTTFQSSVTNFVRAARVDIHNFGPLRTLMLIDGMRYPANNHDASSYDPSIIPTIALERLDVLADGASATYGSDAVAGVVNVILRRNYDGAITQVFFSGTDGGNFKSQFSQLYGRTWDGGDVTFSVEAFDEQALKGSTNPFFTYDFTPWGLDNRNLVKSAIPGIVSTGNPTPATGTTCTNCYSVPRGQNGVGLTWATLLANKGVNNLINPYFYADILPAQRRMAETVTFDQRVIQGVKVFAEAFYSNRRLPHFYGPAASQPFDTADYTQTVPTTNPYYPAGAPAGLRVSYSVAAELNPYIASFEISGRYAGGLDVELPADWNARLFYSVNEERSQWHQVNTPNLNNIAAALGNTVTDPDGTLAPFTKPANVPYLNPFCDPTAFTCNSKATLDYINADHLDNAHYLRQEAGINFDGPLVELPGGMMRGAVGANYFRDSFNYTSYRKELTVSNQLPALLPETLGRKVYAVFSQLNIPIIGEANAVPMFKRLDLEISGRYDHYDDFGGTTNPKLAANWMPIDGLTLSGSWGRSFRAPAFGNLSYVLAKRFTAQNQAVGGPTNSVQICTADQVAGNLAPTPGTAAAAILQSVGAANCGNAAITAATGAAAGSAAFNAVRFPGGVTQNGGSGLTAGITRLPSYVLGPEKAKNYTFGFEFMPTFLPRFDIHATYYHTLIEGVLAQACGDLNDPLCRENIFVRGNPDKLNRMPFGDALDPAAPGAVSALQRFTTGPQAPAGIASVASNIRYVSDTATVNLGSEKLDGVDFGVGYDWDLESFGTWNAGIDGTYALHDETIVRAGAAPTDPYSGSNTTAGIGNATAPRFHYRGRLGWRNDAGFSVTASVNYQAHYFHTNVLPPVPPPNYSNIVPSFYTFDLSLGYDTGDNPANDYLKHLNFRVVANNVFDRNPPFVYRVATNGGVTAYDGTLFSPVGRVLSLAITKTW